MSDLSTLGMPWRIKRLEAENNALRKAMAQWQKIDSAPKDGSVILVDDSNALQGSTAPWVAAKWFANEVWSGWIYDDDLLNDSCPLGPEPKYWLANMPPLPKDL